MLEDILEKSRKQSIKLRNKIAPSNFVTLTDELENHWKKTNIVNATSALSLKDRLYSGPIIGYLAKVFVSIARLPIRLKQIYEQLDRAASEIRELRTSLAALASSTSSKFKEANETTGTLQSLNHNVVVQNENFRSELREKITRCLEAIPALESKFSRLNQGSLRSHIEVIPPSSDISPAFYAAFERHFRSSNEDLHQHFANYIPFLQKLDRPDIQPQAIDLGCGRGEWLKILHDQGFKVTGVDTNITTNAVVKNSHICMIDMDALQYLQSIENATTDLVTSFHLIEHLDPGYLLKLVQEAFRALKPGGMLILETPNPENVIVGACNFYMDPTHKRPIPPAALAFMIDYYGFDLVECMRFHPAIPAYGGSDDYIQKIANAFSTGQDYAIIAKKPNKAKDFA